MATTAYNRRGSRMGERIEVQPNEDQPVNRIANPQKQPCVLPPDRVNEEPDHEGQPYYGHPTMAILIGIDLPPDFAQRLHLQLLSSFHYCRPELNAGTMTYQSTATTAIANPKSIVRPLNVRTRKTVIAIAQRIHSVRQVISTFDLRFSLFALRYSLFATRSSPLPSAEKRGFRAPCVRARL